jgi:hypothetical protein
MEVKNIKFGFLFKFIIWGVFLINTQVFATSPLSQYKQFGSVAALAEACLQSKKIPVKLNEALANTGLDEQTMASLINAYNDGYKSTLLSYKIWIAEKEIWNDRSFSCVNEKDKELIEKFEKNIYSSF